MRVFITFAYGNFKRFNATSYGEGSCNITLSLSPYTKKLIRSMIISLRPISLKQSLTGVDFIYNDDPENYQFIPITIDKSVRTALDQIDNDIIDIDDVDYTNRKSIIVLEYIDNELKDEIKEISKFINKTQAANKYREVLEILNRVKSLITNEIDNNIA